jgi:hypothetical protein
MIFKAACCKRAVDSLTWVFPKVDHENLGELPFQTFQWFDKLTTNGILMLRSVQDV